MNGFDALAVAFPTVVDWEESAPGRWRGRGGLTDMVVLAVVDGPRYLTTWMGEERPELNEQIWQKLQARIDATKPLGLDWFAQGAAVTRPSPSPADVEAGDRRG